MSITQKLLDVVKADFDRIIENFEIVIEQDDGVHRCIYARQPGTGVYSFRVVTWPGYLAIAGDIDGYSFTRLRDMFEFFDTEDGVIRPGYWQEKLDTVSKHRPCKVFNQETFVEELTSLIVAGLDDAVSCEDVIKAIKEAGAMDEWYDHECVGDFLDVWNQSKPFDYVLDFYDVSRLGWQWNWSFIWALYAIVWTVNRYNEKKGE